ncbi:uncharacterized protein LOC135343372 [Halichondria panicea]|uniref:uncharacterized protein LOC135343372 n=1 Tax=Halichondria panicea TaxID=6063 RepID=UPI00312B4414
MAEQLAFHKKRRTVVRSSLTKLSTKLTELEANPHDPTLLESAKNLAEKLKTLEQQFKNHQLSIIDRIEDDNLMEEQEALDENDDVVSGYSIRIQRLITAATPSTTPDTIRVVTKQLALLQAKVESVSETIHTLDDEEDDLVYTLEEYRDQMIEIKVELTKLNTSLLTSDAAPEDAVMRDLAKTERTVFTCIITIKKRLCSINAPAAMPSETSVTKLPKLELPTFQGDILRWKNFWEQFCVSVHERTTIPKEEKLMYLQNAIKDKTAKNIIAGLTKSSDHYDEAIKCLKERYDRPRQIHQTHVRHIVEVPALRDGTGKEIRALHDIVTQHLRALKSLGHEPSQAFITSLLEMKLDSTTMFEWQKHSQEHSDVPNYQVLLDFLNLRAQAAEAASTEKKRASRPVNSMFINATTHSDNCAACGQEKHQLYACSKFRSLSHDEKIELLRSKNHCLNCLRPGHFVKKCKSLNHCKHCQKPHHSLLHTDKEKHTDKERLPAGTSEFTDATSLHVSVSSNILLMTCQVMVETPQGVVKARALLDTGSSASFVSERLAQALHLRRSTQNARICGIAGLQHSDGKQSVTQIIISSMQSSGKKHKNWKHLDGLTLADPDYNKTGRIDILLGIGVFVDVIRFGRRSGPRDSPTALNTEFGWVLAGSTGSQDNTTLVTTHLTSVLTGDDILRQFWEVEEKAVPNCTLTLEERSAIEHFQTNYVRKEDGRFMVPLPKRPQDSKIGESRAQAVRRFLSFERSIHSKGIFPEVRKVIEEYFDDQHAEEVPTDDLEKPQDKVFYLPIHVVHKESSTTTKVCAVFDASATTSTGTSLNSTLMVGPTVHPPLLDVLIRFRNHRIAMIADVSRMYRAVLLTDNDKDLHRFVWRNSIAEPLKDYRMTRVTFGVSASSFVANMCVKQNAIDLESEYPCAAKQVHTSFYVDDYLGGADSSQEAVKLQLDMHALFKRGGFLLRKWSSSDPSVLKRIPKDLRDSQATVALSESDQYTKTLGIEWNASHDHFRVNVTELPPVECMTKRSLVSDVAKTFDALGWYSPTIIKAKILLQMLWLEKVGWDDRVPDTILEEWSKWRRELPMLSTHHISRCYYPKEASIVSTQLHGFSDASEKAYSSVVYLRMEDTNGVVYTSLVTSKTRVAPIKRLTIPRLELNGALTLAQQLSHCKNVLDMPSSSIHAWTDSTIVLAWIQGNPRRFKVYVGNRVAQIMDLTPADCWKHVASEENPADCASRGLFPSELIHHDLWWNGPSWVKLPLTQWPKNEAPVDINVDDGELCTTACNLVITEDPLIPIDKFSSFDCYKRVIAWIMRFVHNFKAKNFKAKPQGLQPKNGCLTTQELKQANDYLYSVIQTANFPNELRILKTKSQKLPISSKIRSLNPTIDDTGIVRVGGRQQKAKFSYNSRHPVILDSKHPLVKLLIRSEHKRLLHGGSLLVSSSLFRNFHLLGGHRAIRSIIRQCVICRRQAPKPSPQMMGQLPTERITPDIVFENVGLDYAGPLYLKRGSVRKPIILKSYVCVFVSMSVKAVHLELVSDLTTESFIACLRRFIARRGKPTSIWSDHGTNFVGANRVLKELHALLLSNQTIHDFCSTQGIDWHFIPERAPHFGGLWEAAVKSFKTHLTKVVGNSKLDFEEMCTVLTQVEACLNSRPLGNIPHNDDEGIEMLTPGHFLIGRPVQAIPDHPQSSQPQNVLRRWYLCQSLVRHFWERWRKEYLVALRKYSKWKHPSKNLCVGDVVVLKEDNLVTSQWPLARIMETNAGADGLVRVVTLKTKDGIYKRPVTKVALLLPCEN